MRFRKIGKKVFLYLRILLVLFFICCTVTLTGASEMKIAVLVSNSGQPYMEALSGFKSHLEKKEIHADYKVYMLEGDQGKALQAVQEIKKSRPNLLFCIGGLAADQAAKEISDTPVIASMVLRPEELKKANVTGVALDFSVETHLQWIRRVLPKVKTVGVLYNPKENKAKIETASRVAQKLGLRLEALEVLSPKDLPAALERLGSGADALWGIADNLVMTPQTAKTILLFSLKHRLPFIGPSSSWVKAGALFSLDSDFTDMGAQCGEMAVKLLQGASITTVQPTLPRKVGYSINMKTATEIGLKIPDDIARSAHNTF
jgi:putative ABC transport system substrate-binding protein